MLIANIEAQLRTRTWVSTSQYSQAQFLLDINEAKDEFWSAVVARLEEDSNYEIWTVDETTTNTEYVMPAVAYNTAWTKMLKWVSIAYNDNTYSDTWLLQYTKAREVGQTSLPKEWNYYVENQPQDDPIYYIADNSYFIAPSFRTAALANRIKLTWIRKIADYTISTTEANMKIPVDFQRLLIWAVIPFALMAKRVDDNTVQKAQNDYEAKKINALQNMASRKEWPISMLYPDQQNEEDIIITT